MVLLPTYANFDAEIPYRTVAFKKKLLFLFFFLTLLLWDSLYLLADLKEEAL